MNTMTETVLFAARDPEWTEPLRALLEREGRQVLLAQSTRDTLTQVREHSPAVVVVEQDLEPITTSSFLDAIRGGDPPPEIILLTDQAGPAAEVQGSLGLLSTASKSSEAAELAGLIDSTLKRRALLPQAPKSRHALILCVDDDDLFLASMSRLLTRQGYHVRLCRNAAEALASMADARPDLAIVDIMMPGTDGYALTEKICALSNGRVPVVLMTALSSDEACYEGHARGARYFMVKPCPQEEVLRVVHSLVDGTTLQEPPVTGGY